MSSTRRSAVWNVFTQSKKSKGTATCNICLQELSFRTTITNLFKHLRRMHPDINLMLNSSARNQNQKHIPELLPKDIEIVVDNEYDIDPLKIEYSTEDNCESTPNNSYKNESSMWIHFTKIPSSTTTAVCNICDKHIFYNTTPDIIKHLKEEHPEELSECVVDATDSKSDLDFSWKCSFCLEALISETDLQNHIQKYHPEQLPNKLRRKETSMWKYFTKIPFSDETAVCNFCQSEISYKSNIANLENHLVDNHKYDDSESEENLSDNKEEVLDSIKELTSNQRNSSHITSRLWEFFTKIPDSNLEACCNLCKSPLSYRSSTFNLKRHLDRKHPEVLASTNEGVEQTLLIDKPFKEELEEITIDECDIKNDSFIEQPNLDNDKNNKRSQIWNVFTIKSAEKSIATCNVCDQQFSYKSTTHDLRRHFQRKHPDVSIESKIEKVAVKIDPDKSDTALDSNNSDYESGDQDYLGRKSKKQSILWKYFTKSRTYEYIASCNICKKDLGYKTSTTNLRKHLNNKHPHIQINSTSNPDKNQAEIKSNTTNDNANSSKKAKYYSAIWKYFTRNKPDQHLATCNICHKEICYKTSNWNLKKHMSNMHFDIEWNMEEELSQKQVSKQSSDEDLDQNLENNHVDNQLCTSENTKSLQSIMKKERKVYSKIWNHFTKKNSEECTASCNICDKEIGYRTSTSNLKKHLYTVHPDVDFQLETKIPQNQINLGTVKSCLICLQNNRELPKIFYQISNTGKEEQSYVTKIGEILNENIVIDESHVICQSCVDDIEIVYNFKQKISKAFDFWTKLEAELEANKIIKEPNNDPDDSEVKNNLEKFTCERCRQEFNSAFQILNHICTRKPKNQDEVVAKPKEYKCKFCGTVFNKHWKRDRHSSMCRNRYKKYDCTSCEKSYKSAFLLREHMTIHTGEHNYMCHLCGKTFRRASVRHKHMQAHNRKPGEKANKKRSFLCSICGKIYPVSVASRHMRVHSGVKRIECYICHKRFDQLTHLKVHLRTHTGERPYGCSICGKEFALTSTLHKHMRCTHVEYLLTEYEHEEHSSAEEEISDI